MQCGQSSLGRWNKERRRWSWGFLLLPTVHGRIEQGYLVFKNFRMVLLDNINNGDARYPFVFWTTWKVLLCPIDLHKSAIFYSHRWLVHVWSIKFRTPVSNCSTARFVLVRSIARREVHFSKLSYYLKSWIQNSFSVTYPSEHFFSVYRIVISVCFSIVHHIPRLSVVLTEKGIFQLDISYIGGLNEFWSVSSGLIDWWFRIFLNLQIMFDSLPKYNIQNEQDVPVLSESV